MKTIYASFTRLLSDLRRKAVTLEELEGGDAFFAFGCSYGHAHHPEVPIGLNKDIFSNEVSWMWPGDARNIASTEGREVHARLMEIVDQADKESRVFWFMDERLEGVTTRLNVSGPTFREKLQQFMGCEIPEELEAWHSGAPSLGEMVKDACLDLKVHGTQQ
jgi:hypothetical protein